LSVIEPAIEDVIAGSIKGEPVVRVRRVYASYVAASPALGRPRPPGRLARVAGLRDLAGKVM